MEILRTEEMTGVKSLPVDSAYMRSQRLLSDNSSLLFSIASWSLLKLNGPFRGFTSPSGFAWASSHFIPPTAETAVQRYSKY